MYMDFKGTIFFMWNKCDFLAALREMPVAIKTDEPKTQHYELPTSFFKLVLGKNLKYRFFSLHCFWSLIPLLLSHLFIFLFNADRMLLKVIDHILNTSIVEMGKSAIVSRKNWKL